MPVLSLDEIERLLHETRTARDLFARAPYRDLIQATLLARNAGSARAEELFQQIQARYHDRNTPPLTVQGPQHTYTLWRLLATGDVADVYFATAISDPATAAESYHVLKMSRVPDGQRLLDNERKVLTQLHAAAGETTYRKYLPALMESFPAKGNFPKRVNVFLHELGFSTLEEVHERHPVLDGRHLAWIFNRLLTVLGYCHQQGIIHGAVLPGHVLIHAGNHGMQLVGWGQSVPAGRRITAVSTRYRDWYPPEVLQKEDALPATDLFLAARCVVYLAGGDPVRNRMPDTVPPAMRRFIDTCLLPGARMRPADAWAVQEDFDHLLGQLYGPRKFHELSMS